MHVHPAIADLREALRPHRLAGARIGLVPTMGNLHQGHLALVEAARERCDLVVASIFVNPLQFGPSEDLENYPRTMEADLAKLEAAGCDMVFTPTPAIMYPEGLEGQTLVRVPGVSEGLCGGSRPGHFDGVSTVVSMLFHIVQPDVACFGEKDYQQLAVIQRMVSDLHLPIEIVAVPTVREASGLAMSSRNGYLSAAEHATAAELQGTLVQLKQALQQGEDVARTLQHGKTRLESLGFRPDYLELRRRDLGHVAADTREAVLLVAARLGATRLIDNLFVTLPR
ncbi:MULTISPECIES: pantoate--beta-alanine ligase [unclassified Halomonas]|uniref:pantoate--beta-alanine ligase n=1 Tax=unclassified Halomonas TaxID=2609666 RepID=UPI001C98E328|nr:MULTISPECIES: pantoate--beta-alanine ligase [unclassified Halomonas]MBY5926698.1 pantoate--beta-alanine ligase [Halomonas sp. DP4Y7-2]MBY6233589.1 pantoate--beta-alanine ligase [Halomonas sp. DP4Y7-1]